jgi:tetratricopeptide (TPR) repeat protein
VGCAAVFQHPARNAAPALAALILLLALPALALARDLPEMRAREQFRAGQAAYANGQYERALGAFSEAYGLQPVPGFLFNIAQCHRKLGNYERAAVFYRQYLDLSPSTANTATVRALLNEIEASEKEKNRRLAEQEKLRRAVLRTTDVGASPLQSALGGNGRARGVAQPAPSSDSIFTKWWFWTGVGVIALGTTTYILASHSDSNLSAVHAR